MRRAALVSLIFLLAACAAKPPYLPPTLSRLPLPVEARGSFELRIVGGAMAGIRTQEGGSARFPVGDETAAAEIRLNSDRLRVDASGWYLNDERFAARKGSFVLRGAKNAATVVTPATVRLPLPLTVVGSFEMRIAGGSLVELRTEEPRAATFPAQGESSPTEIRLNWDRLRVDANGWHLNGKRIAASDGSFVLRDGVPDPDAEVQLRNVIHPIALPGAIHVIVLPIETHFTLIHAGQSPPYPIPGYRPGTHGQGSLHLDHGVPYLRVRGTPEQMGEQTGTLLRNQIRYLIRWYLLPLLGRQRWDAIRMSRTLASHLPRRYLNEIRAIAHAADVGFDDLLLGNMMVEFYQTRMCSALAIRGPLTENGALLIGRNVDFPPHAILQHLTVVIDRQGVDAARLVSVGWPGGIGVVSGMNESGLVAANLIAEYEERTLTGVAYPLLLRMLLEECTDVEGALKLLGKKSRTTGNSILLADAGGEAAVAEVNHWKMKVRRIENDRLFATNLFRSDPDYPFPCGRYDHMVELVGEAPGPLTLPDIERILDEVDIPWNNVQSMIFLPESRRILLAAGALPAAAGPFLPLGLWD